MSNDLPTSRGFVWQGEPTAELAAELESARGLEDVRRTDELARLAAAAEHERALADVAEATRRAELDRAEREASARAAVELGRMYRSSRDAGERTRIAAHMARSGEARALRLERLRSLNLKVLVPVLVGFAAWSTTGVQAGAAWLMHATRSEPTWWALWALEPVLIGVVVWVIIARARLASAGGTMAEQATRIASGCLTTSVLLNIAAAASTVTAWTTGQAPVIVGAMLAHVVGPVGAAATAHLIGVIDQSIAEADPWHDEHGQEMPLLANMADTFSTIPGAVESTPQSASGTAFRSTPGTAFESTAETAFRSTPRATPESTVETASGTEGGAGSFTTDLADQRSSAAVATRRPNAGVTLPDIVRKAPTPVSARAATDEELRARLAALVESGELPESASVRQVQAALGIGFDRAKRVLADGDGAVA